MSVLRWGVLACGLLIAAPAAAQDFGDYSALAKDLAAAAVAYDEAQFSLNRPELERWLADDYILAGSDGRNHDKAESLTLATTPGGADKKVVISQQVMRTWPNGAVLGGIVDASETVNGKRNTFRGRFADIWAKRNGRWQVIFTQIEEVK